MNKESVIKSLQTKLLELESVYNSTDYYTWNLSLVSKLEIICPKNSIVKSIRDINAVGYKSDETQHAKERTKTLISGLIQDIEDFGLEKINFTPQENNKNALNLSLNQQINQSQSTTISINFEFIIDVLKGELRNSEIEELKEILDSSDEPIEKKKRFIDKIKSFGSDVASNILANLLTNPQVYSQLAGMF